MSVTKTWAGSSFNLPSNREPKSSNWGTETSNFLIKIADQAIPKTGGLNTLTADLSFGPTYGVVTKYLTSVSSNPSTTGVVRFANNEGIGWRNATNAADLILKVNASNRLDFNGVEIPSSSSTDVLENKQLEATCALVDTTDNTKQIKWDLALLATTKNLTVTDAGNTQSRIITIPVLAGNRTLDFIDQAQTVSAIKTFTAANIHLSTLLIQHSLTNPKAVAFSVGGTADKTTTLGFASTDNRLINFPDANDTLMGKATTDTLTNKTFDADGTGNSISNIENADIKAAAAIARTKLADGSNDHVLINTNAGVMSSEAQLAKTRGGTGISSTATYPATGTVAVTSDIPSVTNLVTGPAIAIDNEIARFDNTTGKIVQAYTATGPIIDDNGIITVNNATDASDKDTGSMVLQGGLAVEKKIFVGTDLHTDHILETNSAHGVNIDGVLLKDNDIATVAKVVASGVVGKSDTDAVLIPVGTTAQGTTVTKGAIRYNDTLGRYEGANGSAYAALGGGGGLVVLPKTHTTVDDDVLVNGYHYIVNMSGATTNVSIALPAGSTASNIRVSVVPASLTYKLTITANGAETFVYGGATGLTAIDFPAGSDTWAEFCWNGSSWSVEDATVPLSGTFSGALTVTGALTPSGGIKGKTDGVAVAAGYVGETVSYTAVASNGIVNQTSYTNFGTDHYLLIPSKGVWLVIATGSEYIFSAGGGSNVSGSIELYNTDTTTQLAEVQDAVGINVNDQYINSGFSMAAYLTAAGAETIRLRGKTSANATFAVRAGSRILAIRIAA